MPFRGTSSGLYGNRNLHVAMKESLERSEKEDGPSYLKYYDFYDIPNESTCLSNFKACYNASTDRRLKGCLFGTEDGTQPVEGQCITCGDELSSGNAAECVGVFPEGITIASIPDDRSDDHKIDILVSKVHNSSQFGIASAALSVTFDADDVNAFYVHTFFNISEPYMYAFLVNDGQQGESLVFYNSDPYLQYQFFMDSGDANFGVEIVPMWVWVKAQKSTPIKNVKIYGGHSMEAKHGVRVMINGFGS